MNVHPIVTSTIIVSSIPHTLDELRPGQSARIIAITPNGLADRISDLGFTAGATVRCELVSLFGDPMAFRILNGHSSDASCRGYSMIALRRMDARTIQTLQCQDDTASQECPTSRQTDAESRAVWD